MDNLININNKKDNILEFEMSIDGANTSDVECYFVIVAKDMEFRFKSSVKDKKKNMWNVTIPAMNFLERTTYKCFTEVITDGQYFKPMSGNVNVVGSAEIYTSTPQNKTIGSSIEKPAPKKEPVKKEPKKKNESWKPREKSIEQIANELMAKQKTSSTQPPVRTPDPIVENKAEKKVEKVQPIKPAAKTTTDSDKIRNIADKVKEAVNLVDNKNKPVPETKSNEKADKLKLILKENAKEHSKHSKPINVKMDSKVNEELVKAMIKEKEEERKKSASTKLPESDPRLDKIRAILEESGIKPKEKKPKFSFVK